MSQAYAAVDLGPEGGQVVVGRLEDGRLALRLAHRFATRTVRVDETLRWDIHRLYGEVLAGLSAARQAHGSLASAAVDGWGADFGLLDAQGKLLGLPYHHPERRAAASVERLHVRVPEAELWAATGAQSVPSTTLHQLHAMVSRRSSTLTRAVRLLLVPDLLAYWLCGEAAAEHSIAATTQCYDPQRRAWIAHLLASARIPAQLFPPIRAAGTALGPVRPGVARRAGIAGLQVTIAAGHAPAAAVATFADGDAGAGYVVSGRAASWVGAVVRAPVKTDAARRLGLDNHAGVDGTICLQRSAAGLAILEECRRAWARAGVVVGEPGLPGPSTAGGPLRAAFHPDDPALAAPADMPAAVQAACARSGQAVPATPAELQRAVQEVLAWSWRRRLRGVEEALGRRLDVVHLVGPAARSAQLCQLTADACGRCVLAGPVEASALGNVLAQAIAAGACGSWAEARELARVSYPRTVYEPQGTAAWDEASERLERLFAQDPAV